jgi:hypothetical protein
MLSYHKKINKFKLVTKYQHKRSDGLSKDAHLDNLLRRDKCQRKRMAAT